MWSNFKKKKVFKSVLKSTAVLTWMSALQEQCWSDNDDDELILLVGMCARPTALLFLLKALQGHVHLQVPRYLFCSSYPGRSSWWTCHRFPGRHRGCRAPMPPHSPPLQKGQDGEMRPTVQTLTLNLNYFSKETWRKCNLACIKLMMLAHLLYEHGPP